MALTFKDPATELPVENQLIIIKYTVGGVEKNVEAKMQRCYTNDSPSYFTYNYYFAHPASQERAIPTITSWAKWQKDWKEQLVTT